MSCYDLVSFHRSVNFVLVTLRESILDNPAQRKGFLSLEISTLICTLFSAGNFRVVKIFLEKNVRVVVHLSGLDSEAVVQSCFMAMIENILVGIVLLAHARVTAIKGEVRKV